MFILCFNIQTVKWRLYLIHLVSLLLIDLGKESGLVGDIMAPNSTKVPQRAQILSKVVSKPQNLC